MQLLDKQQRLTVSTIEDKRRALLAGLGVATMPYEMVEKDIAAGRLRVIGPEYSREADIIMAWRRDSMGRLSLGVCARSPSYWVSDQLLRVWILGLGCVKQRSLATPLALGKRAFSVLIR